MAARLPSLLLGGTMRGVGRMSSGLVLRPMTPSDVSDVTGRSPNAISPLLRALEREALIKRNPNSADRRSHYLALTAAGKRTAQKLRTEEQAFIRSLLKGRSTRDLASLEKSLLAIQERAGSVQRGR